MEMSAAALENDKTLGLPLIPVKEIYLDHDFNCRGHFGASDCIELAKDIAAKGLQQPIIVRPLRLEAHKLKGQETLSSEKVLIDQGYTHMMLAGHRRLTAYKINEGESIPSIVKSAFLPDFEARDINAVENLQRKELNLGQEALAVRHYYIANWTREDTAQRVNMSMGWVQIRFQILSMPSEVLDVALTGYLTQADVRELHKERDPRTRLKMLGLMRDARIKGERGITTRMKKKDKTTTKKHRRGPEIFEMMDHIRNALKDVDREQMIPLMKIQSPEGNSLTTKVLAWAAGEISTIELHNALKHYAGVIGLEYEMPIFADTSSVNF